MRRLAGIALLLLSFTGCGSPYQATVYGRSGKLYQAPALCKALIACKNAEQECYYETVLTQAGNEYSCKEAK